MQGGVSVDNSVSCAHGWSFARDHVCWL